ncbi:DUF5615 family PIN-like protein [Kitasatospora sp. NPDC005856]|uniref:DUF5615 family PIN-like protein n=1 Tax=Kitasatospora sp. NPDC005856 TaxID=3154566 RepID=UPI00340E1A6C
MPKTFYKHKLLLDEQLPGRREFPRTNRHFDVKHVVQNLRQAGASDFHVYQLATALDRILVTKNVKDFKPLLTAIGGSGVIGIPPHWKSPRTDSTLTALLMRHGPAHFTGKYVALGEVPDA